MELLVGVRLNMDRRPDVLGDEEVEVVSSGEVTVVEEWVAALLFETCGIFCAGVGVVAGVELACGRRTLVGVFASFFSSVDSAIS